MSEVITIESKVHFLDMSLNEKFNFRWQKIINGQLVLALCLHPETPMLCHISLFVFKEFKPVYLGVIAQEHWDDDYYLIYLLNKNENNISNTCL